MNESYESEVRRLSRSPVRLRPPRRPVFPIRPLPPRQPVVDLHPAWPYPPPETGGDGASGGYTPAQPPPPEGSEYVRWVQSALNQVLGVRLPIDGIMSAETRRAVREFQQRQRLPADGLMGPDTQAALVAARRRQPSRELQFESSDREWEGEVSRRSPDYIRWVQDSLNKFLSLRLAVDGKMGPQTRSAIRSFQQRQGLTVDGIVGSRTEAALIAAGAPPAPRVGQAPRQRASSASCPPPGCPPPADLTAAERTALAVTTNFETGTPFGCAVSRVDGISMGMLQWNLKANTLQTLLRQFEQQGGSLDSYLGAEAAAVRQLIALPPEGAVNQATTQGLAAHWKDGLCRLCSDPLFCRLQVQDIKGRMRAARAAAAGLGLGSVRGLAMMFDIHVGDGYGRRQHKLAAFRDRIAAAAVRLGRELTEQEKLVEIADQAASYAGKYQAERRSRRMVIANGAGAYRRSNWNLDQLFPNLNDPAGL